MQKKQALGGEWEAVALRIRSVRSVIPTRMWIKDGATGIQRSRTLTAVVLDAMPAMENGINWYRGWGPNDVVFVVVVVVVTGAAAGSSVTAFASILQFLWVFVLLQIVFETVEATEATGFCR